MNPIAIITLVVTYWPAVVAGSYLLFVASGALYYLVSGQTAQAAAQAAQLPAALAAVMAALGYQSARAAHAKIELKK